MYYNLRLLQKKKEKHWLLVQMFWRWDYLRAEELFQLVKQRLLLCTKQSECSLTSYPILLLSSATAEKRKKRAYRVMLFHKSTVINLVNQFST